MKKYIKSKYHEKSILGIIIVKTGIYIYTVCTIISRNISQYFYRNINPKLRPTFEHIADFLSDWVVNSQADYTEVF